MSRYRLVILFLFWGLSACDVLTGIPGHGGGKRFSDEDSLLSSSLRSSLAVIDVSALKGERVAIVFSVLDSDKEEGSIVGGRASLGAITASGGLKVSPTETGTDQFEVYQLVPENAATLDINSLPTIKDEYTEKTREHQESQHADLVYQGLSDYSVLPVSKAHARLLTSLTRNYLILNGIGVTTPQDARASVILYVTIDILGAERKLADLAANDNDRQEIETAIEVFAVDRSGRIVMRPQVSSSIITVERDPRPSPGTDDPGPSIYLDKS